MSRDPPDSSSLDQPSAPQVVPAANVDPAVLGTASSSTSQTPPAAAAPAKNVRKTTDGDASQSRLTFGAGNGGWTIGRTEVSSADTRGAQSQVVAARKGKARARADEEEETKEMARRAKVVEREAKAAEKQALKEAKVAEKERERQAKAEVKEREKAEKAEKKKRKSRGGGVPSLVDPDLDELSSPEQIMRTTATSSPVKKRGRARLSQEANHASPSATNGDRPSTSPDDVVITGQTLRLPHPFFSRSTSTASTGASHDPIQVDTSPPDKPPAPIGPRKLFFAADRQPVHSFFSHKNPASATLSRPMSRTASATSQVPSEPVVTDKGKKKAVHGFFNGKSQDLSTQAKGPQSGWGRGIKEGEEAFAPLPRGLWPSHCNHVDLLRSASYSVTRRRKRPPSDSVAECSQSVEWRPMLDLPPRSLATNGHLQKPPQASSSRLSMSERYPAFEYLQGRRSSRQATWPESLRPTCAEGILGNDVEATYLRDWLRALEVGNPDTAGQKVHRKVRRLKRQLFDGWIVDDAGLFGDFADDPEDEEPYEEYYEPLLALGDRPASYPRLHDRLTNCIILAGPHGVGKTASVYTAAEELGWEVFEVYPGMGRRTAANLMSWVGDVGTNHMVVKGKGTKDAKMEIEHVAEISAFFGNGATTNGTGPHDDDIPPNPKRKKQHKNVILSSSQGSEKDPIDVIGEEEDGKDEPVAQRKGSARQSLIMIDEADILFAEENTFWPAVISLIAESRRPIILTCNDSTRIPSQQLPLQAILHYQPASPELAIPFLASVAEKQGIREPQYAAELYLGSSRRAPHIMNQPVAPNGNEWLPSFDLRQCLMQMQLDRSHVPARPDVFEVDTSDLHSVTRCLDYMSYVDAWITAGPAEMIETCEVDRSGPTVDDELGPHLLPKATINESRPVLAGYDCADAFGETLIELAGGRLDAFSDLNVKQIEHIRSLLPALDPVIPLNSYLLPHPSLFLDYVPILQALVETDDVYEEEEEAALAEGGSRVSRKTGRPKRSAAGGVDQFGPERYMDLGAEGLRGVRESMLHF